MTWPNTTVSTTHLDAGTDEPRLARADLKDAVDKLNTIITDGPTRGFVEFGTDGGQVSYSSGSRRRANVVVNFETGPTIISRVVANTFVHVLPGIYKLHLPLIETQGTGDWQFTSNTGELTFLATTTTDRLIKQTSSPPGGALISAIFTVTTVANCDINYSSTVANPPVEAIHLTRLG